MSPRIGELFAGYGGLGMGVQAALGGELAWYSEIDKGALKILEHRFPDVPNIGDITTVDWSTVEPVDILTGGFPCQDVSAAGKRAGLRPGTRSGLWSHFAYAIEQLRPGLVVIENVRGLLSAEAHSDMEPCPWCLGDGAGSPLRALGAVLGDLADLGLDACWYGLPAAEIGAPHGRWREFVLAYPAADARGEAGQQRPGLRADEQGGDGRRQSARDGGPALLPTPRATDGTKGGPNQRGSSGDLMLPSAVQLLGTPRASEWKGTGPVGSKSHAHRLDRNYLDAQVVALLPTPTSMDAHSSGGSTPSDVTLTDAIVRTNLGQKENPRHAVPTQERPEEELSDLRGATDPEEIRERSARGSRRLSPEDALLATLCEHEGRYPGELAPLAREAGEEADGLRGMRNDPEASRSSQGSRRDQQQSGESGGAVRELSPEAALARGRTYSFGQYEAAVQRWEQVLGRTAPPPTTLSVKRNPQLSAAFTEFLMGLPTGWVTDVPGITRNEALKALGNGVVPQQAEAAIRCLLERIEVAA